MTNFRFAVMGAGNIANKFCDAVNRIADCEVAAVASKSMERAQAFARKNGLKAAYDSYEKMLIEAGLRIYCSDHGCPLCPDYALPGTQSPGIV